MYVSEGFCPDARLPGLMHPPLARLFCDAHMDRSLSSHASSGFVGGWAVVVFQDLRDAFYSFGELRSIRIVPGKDFAFVQFTTRQAAEAAAEQLYKVRHSFTWCFEVEWGAGEEFSCHARS